MEIERKFLVAALPDLATAEPVAVRQGYLTRPEDSVEMRLVEVEFDSRAAAEAFALPEWFGAEVTGIRAYSNKVMAFEGTPATPEPQ